MAGVYHKGIGTVREAARRKSQAIVVERNATAQQRS